MRIKKLGCYHSLFVVLLSFFYFSPAYGLSCMPPVLDEAVIDEAVLIFEGEVEVKRELSAKEKAALARAHVTTKGGGLSDLKVYSFKVEKGWKGINSGEEVEVLRNTYWGDGFPIGERFLIVSNEKVKDLYVTSLCGPSISIRFARDQGSIKTLEEIIGKGR